jgi:hypothetical protein
VNLGTCSRYENSRNDIRGKLTKINIKKRYAETNDEVADGPIFRMHGMMGGHGASHIVCDAET